jgi:hypothetical protein
MTVVDVAPCGQVVKHAGIVHDGWPVDEAGGG